MGDTQNAPTVYTPIIQLSDFQKLTISSAIRPPGHSHVAVLSQIPHHSLGVTAFAFSKKMQIALPLQSSLCSPNHRSVLVWREVLARSRLRFHPQRQGRAFRLASQVSGLLPLTPLPRAHPRSLILQQLQARLQKKPTTLSSNSSSPAPPRAVLSPIL